jgi:hypothetical protein
MAAGLGQGTGRSSCLMMHVKWVVLIHLTSATCSDPGRRPELCSYLGNKVYLTENERSLTYKKVIAGPNS